MVVQALLADLEICEVPSCEADRIHGESKLSAWRDGCRVLATLLRKRFIQREAPLVPSATLAT